MKNMIDSYLENHRSNYVGKYQLLSSVKVQPFEYKFRYYTRDDQFRDMHVFVSILFVDGVIENEFSIKLNEQEKVYILKDCLNLIKIFLEYKTLLHADIFDIYLKNNNPTQILEPQDYRNILDYLQYHEGITQSSVDKFHHYFIPYLTTTLENRSYQNTIDALGLYFEKVLYEYTWNGVSSNYIDFQYHLHMEYINKIFLLICKHLQQLYQTDKQTLIAIFYKMFEFPRFVVELVDSLTLTSGDRLDLNNLLGNDLASFDGDDTLGARYFKTYIEINTIMKRKCILEIIDTVVFDYITYDNVDLQLNTSKRIISEYGYDIVLEFFRQNYNTFIFQCFKIDSFPKEYITLIKNELEKAILFYSARSKHINYQLSSFEQVFNINRLLLEFYKET